MNGGETWSSWYNQPTAQFYHVITDNQRPYWVYGGQQESGSVGIASRGNDGQITFRDWHPVGADEYGYIAPDPLDPNIVYGGKVHRYNKRDGRGAERRPPRGSYRYVRTAPLLFSYVDPHVLYLGAQMVLKTTNGGADVERDQPRPFARDLRSCPPAWRRIPTRRSARPRAAAWSTPSRRRISTWT